ncbi:hypothetical protein [Dactylosporangium sp. CA-139066]|uniref:hypothetical protein n=1 Tax=Dactylosporangium sp. CA-139066 TaxID=3239930 RepID=UPI003D8B62E4
MGFRRRGRTSDPAALGVGAVLNDDDLGDGWRLFQVEARGAAIGKAAGKGDPARLSRTLAERTGSPALAAFVLDSDCAVLAVVSGSQTRQIAVNPEVLEDYGPPDDEELLDGDEAVDALVAWGEAAGFEPSREAVAAALDADETFVEDKLAVIAEGR